MIRCAIVGVGAVVEDLHLPALRGLPQVEVAAACEPDGERARRFQERTSVPRVYPTLDELLARETGIDFVDIATPAHTHYDIVRQALDAGLHVLVEKPLALTAREGTVLAHLARSKGRKLCVLQNYRYRTPMLRAEEALRAGRLGTLGSMTMTCHWGYDPFSERRGWDWADKTTRLLLYELGVHYADLAVHYAGPLRAMTGFHAVTDPESGAVTSVSAMLEHEGGVHSVFDFAVLTPSRFIRVDLFGSRGDARIKLFPESFAVHAGAVHSLKEIRDEVRRTVDFVTQAAADRLGARVKRRALPHFRLIAAFVESLADPSREVPVTAESAVRTLEVLDALHARIAASRSDRAATGAPVSLAEAS
jgi:predicted dehydrogenase